MTPDTQAALKKLEARAATMPNIQLSVTEPAQATWETLRSSPGPTGLPPEWSAVPTGREVYMGVEILGDTLSPESRVERSLATLWALAVPLGFVPFARYPLPGPHQAVFHFPGPWVGLMDHLLGAGRGEAAWPGFCTAAQVEAGTWEGERALEREVQSLLHRVGQNCGAIDGIIANNTLGCLKALGISGQPLSQIAQQLRDMVGSQGISNKPRREVEGSVDLGSENFSIVSYGQIRTARTAKGARVFVSGPGRIVVDVRES